MEIAFFCSTPYHIILAVNIKYNLHSHDEADIFILNHFPNAKSLTTKICEINLFRKVKFVDSRDFKYSYSKNRILRYLQKYLRYFFYKKTVENYFEFGVTKYDEAYYASPHKITRLALKELSRRNENFIVHLFEDGTGAYNLNIVDNVTSIKKSLFAFLTGLRNISRSFDDIYVFRPDLMSRKMKIPVLKIPDIDCNDSKLKSMINTVFSFRKEYEISENIIFFEQPMNSIKGLNEKIRSVADEVLTNNYIVKLHPRSNSKSYEGHKIYQNNDVPWEVISLNSDIEHKVLISYFSTAGVTNKILFNKEPVIIFLFELQELKELYQLSNETINFVHSFTELYLDQGKIHLPQNMDQLKEILSNQKIK